MFNFEAGIPSKKHPCEPPIKEPQEEEDINEAFDRLVLAEEEANKTGYQEGYEVGKNKTVEAYHLGYHRASLLAARLGYYYGQVNYFLNNRTYEEKVVRLGTDLLRIIENFPRDNDPSVDLLMTADSIKFKFIKFCSLARIDSSYPESDNIDF